MHQGQQRTVLLCLAGFIRMWNAVALAEQTFNPFAVGRPFCWVDSCKKHLNKKRYWQPKRLNLNSLTTNQSHYRSRTLTSHKLVDCYLVIAQYADLQVCSSASVPSSFRKKTKTALNMKQIFHQQSNFQTGQIHNFDYSCFEKPSHFTAIPWWNRGKNPCNSICTHSFHKKKCLKTFG